jgi:hypothetical protein
MNKEEFIHPRSRYYGDFSPQNLAFNQNLQEFSSQIGIIVGLETGGKLTAKEAYSRIKKLFKELKASKKGLLEEQANQQ